MNDKQKQIEEMAKDLEEARSCARMTVGSLNNGFGGWYGAYMYKKGYRKQSETAKEILKWLKFLYVERQKEYTNWDGNKINAVATEWLNADIETIAAQYGVEVEE